MTAILTGDVAGAVQAGEDLQRLATELHALSSFLRGVSTDVVKDVDSAAVSAKQAGAYLSEGAAGDPAEAVLPSLARQSISEVEGRWIERVRNAGVSCA